MGKRAKRKITNETLTMEFLATRTFTKFGDPKWVMFARYFVSRGYDVELYEARQTHSKYLTVIKGNRTFKVRFSDHKPIMAREIAGDCDYFVGRTNLRTTTTDQAIMAAEIFMERN